MWKVKKNMLIVDRAAQLSAASLSTNENPV